MAEREHKNKIEAILFTTGRFMALEEISKLCEIGSIGFVKGALLELKQEYEQKNSALELVEENNRWKLNIKKMYSPLTHQLLTETELDKPAQETLAIIAFKQPALQSEVIKIRGNKAYDHIKALKDAEFIISEKFGRTRLLKLATKFFDYFDIEEKGIKEKMEEASRKILTQPISNTKNNDKKEEKQEEIKDEQLPQPYPKPDPEIYPDPKPTPNPSPEPGIGPENPDEEQEEKSDGESKERGNE